MLITYLFFPVASPLRFLCNPINPAIYNCEFTATTATMQYSSPHPAPGANLQMLQSQKLQQTATNCNKLFHLYQSSNILLGIHCNNCNIVILALEVASQATSQMLHHCNIVTNCNIKPLTMVIYDKKPPTSTATTATMQHWPLQPAPQARSQMLQPLKLQQTATNCNILFSCTSPTLSRHDSCFIVIEEDASRCQPPRR
jgi:hypothetical protein